MEIHKAIIPCERCENSSKWHQIKTHFMTPLVICCRNTCVRKFVCVCEFFFTKCNIHVNYQNLNSFFFHVLLDQLYSL